MAKTLILLKGDSQDTRLNCHQTHTHGIQFFQVNSPGWHKWNSCTLRTYCWSPFSLKIQMAVKTPVRKTIRARLQVATKNLISLIRL